MFQRKNKCMGVYGNWEVIADLLHRQFHYMNDEKNLFIYLFFFPRYIFLNGEQYVCAVSAEQDVNVIGLLLKGIKYPMNKILCPEKFPVRCTVRLFGALAIKVVAVTI